MSEMVLPRFIISVIQYLREGYTEPGEVTGDFNAIKVQSLFITVLEHLNREQFFLLSIFFIIYWNYANPLIAAAACSFQFQFYFS